MHNVSDAQINRLIAQHWGDVSIAPQSVLAFARHVLALQAAPAAPALVPLTPDQRADLWRTTPFRGSGGQFDWFIDGVCAAERHHGIKP
jgi:hypothetical protein